MQPAMEPVAPAAVLSAAPSVPNTPVGQANDLFADVKNEKVTLKPFFLKLKKNLMTFFLLCTCTVKFILFRIFQF